MQNLQPIRLLPARERVAAALRKAILSKELTENETITLEGIAQKLGISSMPVREAFQMLAQEGLILLRPNKGAIILGLQKQTICDHYETRAILESETAAMVCRKNADLTAIQNVFEQANASLSEQNTAAYSNCNQAFHMGIWEAAGNQKIRDLLATMWNGLSMGPMITEEAYAKLSMREHARIWDALVRRNADGAREQMRLHILRSMENMLTHFE